MEIDLIIVTHDYPLSKNEYNRAIISQYELFVLNNESHRTRQYIIDY